MKIQLLQDINESGSRPQSAARRPAPEPETAASASPFASERVDWVGGQVDTEPHWFDRWGRRAATWSAGLAAIALLAGGGLWMYRERSVDSALVLVAKNALPPPKPALSSIVPAPAAPAPPAALPERVADTPILAASPEPAPVARKPVQVQQQRVSTRLLAKALTPPVDPESASTGQLAETLKQCRAMGYHATQCLKRGCVTTRYGLACKG